MTTDEAPSQRTSAGKVLIVDDEPALRRAYLRMLREAGYEVDAAADGAEAIARVAEGQYDVIVSDIGMPGLDGVQLLKRVREKNLDVPVILMTGAPSTDTAIRAVEYGALKYLVKPVDSDALVEHVAQAVRLYRMAKLKRQALAYFGAESELPGDRGGLVASFDRALTSMWMAFQPIVSWEGRKVIAFEALLRSTESTLPHPGAILEAAERLGRLADLGRAIRARVAEVAEGAPADLVFVNLHTRDLLDETLFDSASPLSKVAKRVVLEITERATLDEVKDLRARVGRLRELGFRIALDDLGAGYAGLTSFAHLEPDIVKLDMSLVRDVHKQPTKQKLIRSMVSLCRDMSMKVIAEGVETADERATLIECGCDLFQGYYFAKPAKPFPEVPWATFS